jgi:hypothetical protein
MEGRRVFSFAWGSWSTARKVQNIGALVGFLATLGIGVLVFPSLSSQTHELVHRFPFTGGDMVWALTTLPTNLICFLGGIRSATLRVDTPSEMAVCATVSGFVNAALLWVALGLFARFFKHLKKVFILENGP